MTKRTQSGSLYSQIHIAYRPDYPHTAIPTPCDLPSHPCRSPTPATPPNLPMHSGWPDCGLMKHVEFPAQSWSMQGRPSAPATIGGADAASSARKTPATTRHRSPLWQRRRGVPVSAAIVARRRRGAARRGWQETLGLWWRRELSPRSLAVLRWRLGSLIVSGSPLSRQPDLSRLGGRSSSPASGQCGPSPPYEPPEHGRSVPGLWPEEALSGTGGLPRGEESAQWWSCRIHSN